LLGQLGIKHQLNYRSTAIPIPANDRPHSGLAGIRITVEGAQFVAPIGQRAARALLPFDEWWNEPILADARGRIFTRRRIVLVAANTDGGAHVDPNLDREYADLTRNNAFGLEYGLLGRAPAPPNAPHWAILRQIAHELLGTLEDAGYR
jgi:hypothetical protein